MTARSSKTVSYGGLGSGISGEINEGSHSNMTFTGTEVPNGGRAPAGATSGTSGDEGTPLLRYELDRSISTSPINSARNLSTLFGCFMPCVLSIFSAILFLRVGEFSLSCE